MKYMTDEERAALFPIILSEYNPAWPQWYAEEKERLIRLIGAHNIVRVTHIGSTAVPGLTAKPTVDILLEIAENTDALKLIASLPGDEYVCLRQQTIPTHDRVLFLKGYTPTGFAEKVYHIHVRCPGDWDEVRFRDYLTSHPEAADAYAALKRELKKRFEHDRDGYTNAKGEFIKAVTKRARNIAEKMDEFFAARMDIYEYNMLRNVEGLPEGYSELAKHIPSAAHTLLDLGCGTGLELEEIFRRYPDINVTGIDLTQSMLDKLSEKYSGKGVTLICASYLDYDFGEEKYDCVISIETMHHWTHEEKLGLYKNIGRALKPGGRYIECDYMVEAQSEEDYWFSESRRIRAEQNIPDGAFYHLDTPRTVDNQIKLFLQSGFARAEMVWRKGATTLVVAEKWDQRMRITRAGRDELYEIAAFLNACWQAEYSGIVAPDFLGDMSVSERYEKLLVRFDEGASGFLAMRDADKMIGAAVFGKSFTDGYPDDGEISAIYLHHDFIGKGYGHVLFTEVERILTGMGYAHFVLDVLSDNTRAVNFYLAHGYEKVSDSYIRLGEKDYPLTVFRKASPIKERL